MKRKISVVLFLGEVMLALLVAIPIHALAAVHYVNPSAVSPTSPFVSWETGATNIQDAIDIASAGDEVVVTNGIYQSGYTDAPSEFSRSRVAVTKPLTVRSVNGPEVTIIDGDSDIRCVYLTNEATLIGFTLQNGFAGDQGGGVFCESESASVIDCVITRNLAWNFGGGASGGTLNGCVITTNTSAGGGGVYQCSLTKCMVSSNLCSQSGGGAYMSTLNNCVVSSNVSGVSGGGVHSCALNNCVLIGNSASLGGGSSGSTLTNCTLTLNSAGTGGGASEGALINSIAYYNSATDNGPNYFGSLAIAIDYTCTTPMPTNGIGNLTNAPLFVDLNGGDLHLQSNSPCINAGNNNFVSTSFDLEGNPRILADVVDLGAYESPFVRLNVDQLIILVRNSGLSAKTQQPLLSTLSTVVGSFRRGNTVAAVNELTAFQKKVLAQVLRFDADLANQLIAMAQQIIEDEANR